MLLQVRVHRVLACARGAVPALRKPLSAQLSNPEVVPRTRKVIFVGVVGGGQRVFLLVVDPPVVVWPLLFAYI